MNIRKNFEAIFLAAAALGLVASYATAAARPVEVVKHESAILIDSTMHVVVVKAPRLSVAEKAGLK
ncbi:hypothetical protein MasN3_20200 [Massilia varians]|uniref:Uncharacterized protein n=1 Tax=Massilia varians TaxID=457921 RepID=A0ABN6TEA2_9BURK|nr:hypothetical protein [Massilia varians]BDT58526.1 hypothetical protein MasN3_20200 [Massilia varians]